MTKSTDQRLLSPQALADQLDVPVATIYKWRYGGTGPRSIKVGRHVRYRQADVDRWLEQQSTPAAS